MTRNCSKITKPLKKTIYWLELWFLLGKKSKFNYVGQRARAGLQDRKKIAFINLAIN